MLVLSRSLNRFPGNLQVYTYAYDSILRLVHVLRPENPNSSSGRFVLKSVVRKNYAVGPEAVRFELHSPYAILPACTTPQTLMTSPFSKRKSSVHKPRSGTCIRCVYKIYLKPCAYTGLEKKVKMPTVRQRGNTNVRNKPLHCSQSSR